MEKSDRISTSLYIKSCIVCNKCPLKLYAKDDDVVLYGKGFLLPKIIFVLPAQEKDDKQEEYLKTICQDIINIEEQYITYNPKCFTYDSRLRTHTKECNRYLVYEIFKLKPKKVIFFGVDIPQEILSNNKGIEVYKFNHLLNIYFGRRTIEQFRNDLKQIL